MLTTNSTLQGNETWRRLVAAASEEFAQHGFAGARVRNIVDAARVNLAAVNYYFGGKKGLYRATVGFLAGQAMSGFRERRGQTPERRLQRLVYAFLAGLTDASVVPPLGRIIAHEAMHPTAQLDPLIEEMTRPQVERLRAVVRELAGPAVPEREVTLATLAIAGQCWTYLFGRPTIERLFPGVLAGPHTTQRLARQITDFSLAGIARIAALHAAPAPATKQRHPGHPPAAGESAAKKGGSRGH